MPDESLPPPIGKSSLQPPALSPKQVDLCRRLDELCPRRGLAITPSDMFRGAIFAAREECRSNPDWFAQSVHSLREILYRFMSPRGSTDRPDTIFRKEADHKERGVLYGDLSALAHHSNSKRNYSSDRPEEIFERLTNDFVEILEKSLIRQVDVHEKIDEIVSTGPESPINT